MSRLYFESARVEPFRKGAAIAVSSIVLYELWYGRGCRSARRRENADRLCVFLSGGIAVNPFSEEDAWPLGICVPH